MTPANYTADDRSGARGPEFWTGGMFASTTVLQGCRIEVDDECEDEAAAKRRAEERVREEMKRLLPPHMIVEEVNIDVVDRDSTEPEEEERA